MEQGCVSCRIQAWLQCGSSDEENLVSLSSMRNVPPASRWLRDGTAVPDATTAELRISAAGAADGGEYVCQVLSATGTRLELSQNSRN